MTIRAVQQTDTATRPVLSDAQAKKFNVSKDWRTPEHNARAYQAAAKKRMWRKGEGTSAMVDWNTSQGLTLDTDGVPLSTCDSSKAYLGLAHELIHAYRMLKGTFTTDPNGDSGDRYRNGTGAAKEERRAVGLDEFANKKPAENSIRRENTEPERTAYALRGTAHQK